MKYCRYQNAEKKKTKENMRNWNLADVFKYRTGTQSKIYRTKMLQIIISKDDQSKIKYIKLKYCRYQYAERGKQSKLQNWNTANINMQRGRKQSKRERIEIL